MIKKRYQHWGLKGLVWTQWFNFRKGGSELEAKTLSKGEGKWQLKGKLKNEFKYEKD